MFPVLFPFMPEAVAFDSGICITNGVSMFGYQPEVLPALPTVFGQVLITIHSAEVFIIS